MSAVAGNAASALVTFGVEEITALKTSGALSQPVALVSPTHGRGSTLVDNGTYLQYTSTVPDGGTHSISVSIVSGSLPGGCALELEVVGSPESAGGIPVKGGVILSGSPRTIVTGIGNDCTGSGAADGPRIACRLIVTDPAKLVPGESTSVAVSFILD
ncbi:MAG: hypothetical protein WC674_01125 [Candidatus Krumholzibacteriia bacterium]